MKYNPYLLVFISYLNVNYIHPHISNKRSQSQRSERKKSKTLSNPHQTNYHELLKPEPPLIHNLLCINNTTSSTNRMD